MNGICNNDEDLKMLVKFFAKEYFYDFPLKIHDAYFGRKTLTTLGYCKPLNKQYMDNIVSQNMEGRFSTDYINSDIEINELFVGLDISETVLHEMCHSVNFTMNDSHACHGKLFKKVAKVISERSGISIKTHTTDEHLNAYLSCESYLVKIKRNKTLLMTLNKTINSWKDEYIDIYKKAIDGINDLYAGAGDIMSDLFELGDVNHKEDLNDCADELDYLFGENITFRSWVY